MLVVIVSTDDGIWLGRCLESLEASSYRDFETVVVLNACRDDSAELCARSALKPRTLATPRKLGFAEANNLAITEAEAAGHRYVLLLNPDTRVDREALGTLVDCLENHPEYGIVGCWQAEYEDETWSQPNEWTRETMGEARDLGQVPRCRGRFTLLDHYYVQGAALTMRTALISRIGMLDRFYGTFYEETDLCRRARLAGFKVGLLCDSRVRHFGGGNWSRSRRAQEERDRLFLRNQFYYLLSAPELQSRRWWAGWEVVRRQIADLVYRRRHFVLPLWRYPLVVLEIFRKRAMLPQMRARNRAILQGRELEPAQWCLGAVER